VSDPVPQRSAPPSPTRLLFASSEVAGSGGSATAAYDLFRVALWRGYDAQFVVLLDDGDAAWSERVFGRQPANPAGLPNVHVVPVPASHRPPNPSLEQFIAGLRPDVMAGFGHIASRRLKEAAPHLPTAFITGSCRQAQDYVTSGMVSDAMELRRRLDDRTLIPRPVHPGEVTAVDRCDLVITHSPQTFEMMSTFFPGHAGKIWPGIVSFADWIGERARAALPLARPFDERDVDLLFVASNWNRREKNYALVDQLSRRLAGGAAIHVVGDVPYRLPGVTHHGFVGDRDQVFTLIGRSRCVACPSLIDAAPGILYEAIVLGANVVATPNCGNVHVCHPEVLAPSVEVRAFVECVGRAMKRSYIGPPAQPTWRTFDDLMAVLGALARPIGGVRAAG
jgi:glycosyltransferase involved in cell wall biosynthesis